MTQQEYNNIYAEIDCILSELGPDFNDDDPRVERLFGLSNKADEYYQPVVDDRVAIPPNKVVKFAKVVKYIYVCKTKSDDNEQTI